MEGKERAELIRKGNELFNQRNIREALKLFVQADYKDGIVRIGDYFLDEKQDPLKALPLYKKGGYERGQQQVYQMIAGAVHRMLLADSVKEEWYEYEQERGDVSEALLQDAQKAPVLSGKVVTEKGADDSSTVEDDFSFEDFSSKPQEKRKVSELDELRKRLQSK